MALNLIAGYLRRVETRRYKIGRAYGSVPEFKVISGRSKYHNQTQSTTHLTNPIN